MNPKEERDWKWLSAEVMAEIWKVEISISVL
jgi:hypothetical protein